MVLRHCRSVLSPVHGRVGVVAVVFQDVFCQALVLLAWVPEYHQQRQNSRDVSCDHTLAFTSNNQEAKSSFLLCSGLCLHVECRWFFRGVGAVVLLLVPPLLRLTCRHTFEGM